MVQTVRLTMGALRSLTMVSFPLVAELVVGIKG